MRRSIKKEFGAQKPRAIVLDDNAQARRMTARRLSSAGFQVAEYSSVDQFQSEWLPGTVDVIVSDWDLSHDKEQHGDSVLLFVRARDWDVPFVLVSGKLEAAGTRADVLTTLLGSGGARFVKRGADGIKQACEAAEELIERRDLALMKLVLALRPLALRNESISTSTGRLSARESLAELVSKPSHSHDASRPIATARARELTSTQ
jgi:CheY-like chemotaxis protein